MPLHVVQRGSQRVSRVCLLLLSLFGLFAMTSLFVAIGQRISWLQYLYFISYIKLAITLIKYIPQVLYQPGCAFASSPYLDMFTVV